MDDTKDEDGHYGTDIHAVTCEGESRRAEPVPRIESLSTPWVPTPVVPLGDKFLFVWSVPLPDWPRIRMKLAPIDQLAEAPFGLALAKEGVVFEVYPSGDAAVAIINTHDRNERNHIVNLGFVALRIDASGKVEAVALK